MLRTLHPMFDSFLDKSVFNYFQSYLVLEKCVSLKKWCTFSSILIVRDVYRVTSKRIRFESSLHRAFFLRVILDIWTKEKGYKYIKRWTQVPNWLPQRTVKCFYEFNQDPRGFFKRDSNARNNHVYRGLAFARPQLLVLKRNIFFYPRRSTFLPHQGRSRSSKIEDTSP